jgi:hypothetical protein
MSHKQLPLAIFLLLLGCSPKTENILKYIQTPGSGYVYISDTRSVQDELAYMQTYVDKKLTTNITPFIRNFEEIISVKDSINKLSFAGGIAFLVPFRIPFPPNPCPVPGPGPTCNDTSQVLTSTEFISYFTRNPLDDAAIFKNSQLLSVLKESSYNELYKIRTVRIPANLKLNNSDTLMIKLPVEFLDTSNNYQRIIIEYRTIIRKK